MDKLEASQGTVEVSTRTGTVKVAYVMERSTRARRLRLTLGTRDGVVLRLPSRMPASEALRFLQAQGDWIVRARRRRPPEVTLHEYLREQPQLTLRGRVCPVVRKPWPLWRARLPEGTDQVELVGPDDGQREVALAELLRELAAADLPLRVAELASRRALRVEGVTVRDQATRWGSCSSRQRISLNWRLLLLAPALQDYVIWHELAHLTHLHHRASFWNLLARYDSAWQEHDRAVTEWGRTIMRLGRTGREADEDEAGEVALHGRE